MTEFNETRFISALRRNCAKVPASVAEILVRKEREHWAGLEGAQAARVRAEVNLIDAEQICRKWVEAIGVGFHPDTRGASYRPKMSRDMVREYDADMVRLFAAPCDPYDLGLEAMAAAGLLPSGA